MNRNEWLMSGDAVRLATVLEHELVGGPRPLRPAVTPRTLRLMACGFCRPVCGKAWPWSLGVVEAAEGYAEGLVTLEQLEAARRPSDDLAGDYALTDGPAVVLMASAVTARFGWVEVRVTARHAGHALAGNDRVLADVVRDLVPDPWDPAPAACPRCHGVGTRRWKHGRRKPCRYCLASGLLRPWLTPTVLALADAARGDRRPDGSLEPSRLAVLADALEEEGCREGPLLRHLRGWRRCPVNCPLVPVADHLSPWHKVTCPTCGGAGWLPLEAPHLLGCWAVDRARALAHEFPVARAPGGV